MIYGVGEHPRTPRDSHPSGERNPHNQNEVRPHATTTIRMNRRDGAEKRDIAPLNAAPVGLLEMEVVMPLGVEKEGATVGAVAGGAVTAGGMPGEFVAAGGLVAGGGLLAVGVVAGGLFAGGLFGGGFDGGIHCSCWALSRTHESPAGQQAAWPAHFT